MQAREPRRISQRTCLYPTCAAPTFKMISALKFDHLNGWSNNRDLMIGDYLIKRELRLTKKNFKIRFQLECSLIRSTTNYDNNNNNNQKPPGCLKCGFNMAPLQTCHPENSHCEICKKWDISLCPASLSEQSPPQWLQRNATQQNAPQQTIRVRNLIKGQQKIWQQKKHRRWGCTLLQKTTAGLGKHQLRALRFCPSGEKRESQ